MVIFFSVNDRFIPVNADTFCYIGSIFPAEKNIFYNLWQTFVLID
ncbi:hypothetical protein SAMN05421740_103151 [Parapedobacter koreensis]|uniref:Uncharacterized protein n=1 Tax=Parapedobacter koreensis TaxID=332977 RepID=A0A1H7LFM1_9SPHI|nr:hypothetical protein SAMN05421740_103151 [Parapedobacter koreensis]